MRKKALLLILTMLLIFGNTNFVLATEYYDIKGTEYEEIVKRLSSMEIFGGYPDGSFKPNNTITRAEFAAIVVRAKRLEPAANALRQISTRFSDVPLYHWALGYINVAVKENVVNGINNELFNPSGLVKYEEAITMLVRALGYESDAQAKGGYPYGYLIVSNEIGLLNGINSEEQGAPALRGFVAQITNNALDIPMMIKDVTGKWVVSGENTTKKVYIYGDKNTVSANNEPSIRFSESKVSLDDKETIIVTLENPPIGEYSLHYNIKNPSIINCEWGDWIADNSLPLTIYAKSNGTTNIEINLEQNPNIKSYIEVSSNKVNQREESKSLLGIKEKEEYLTEKFGTLNTDLGTTHFRFDISENDSIDWPEDYSINVGFDTNFFHNEFNSIKYTKEERETTKKQLKEHQKKIAEEAIELFPNKKLTGGYHYSFYKYRYIKEGFISYNYYTWSNFKDYDFLSEISPYEQTKPSYFQWTEIYDDEL